MNEYNIKRNLDKVMSLEVPNKPTSFVEELKIDEDTSFSIYYDIYNDENEDYLYIKMVEKTAEAPFYYNRSFTIEELQELDKSWKSCGLKDIKEHIKTLFNKRKIKLFYDNDNNKEIIKMELSILLFEDKYNVYFRLYKEMIPEEMKDKELLNLYKIEKSKIKMIKELASIFNSFSNQEEKAIGEKLKQLIFKFEIPGIEKGQLDFGEKDLSKKININENEMNNKKEDKIKEDDISVITNNSKPKIININENKMDDKSETKVEDIDISIITTNTKYSTEQKKQNKIIPNNNTNYKIFTNVRRPGKKKYHLNEGKSTIDLVLKNITDEDWPMNDIKLICNEETSTIKCIVEDLIYDIEKGQDGQFKLIFDPDDLIQDEIYQCNLELFLRGEKIEDGLAELFIIGGKKNS